MESEDKTLATEGAFTAAVDQGLIDVPFLPKKASSGGGGSSVFGLFGGAIAFLVVYAVLAIALEGLRVSNVVPLAAAVILSLWLLRSHMGKEPARIEEFCIRNQYGRTPEVVSRMIGEFGNSDESLGPGMLFEILTRLQRFGTVVRIGPPECLVQISPFEAPFEPIALGQTGESGETSTEAPDGARRPSTGAAGDQQIRSAGPTILRQVRRTSRLTGRFGDWVTGALLVLGLFFLITTGSLMALVLILGVVLFGFVADGVFEIRWLLSPGALVIRKGTWRSSHTSLHHFTRNHAVLVVHRSADDQWVVVVGDSELIFKRSCSAAQVELLLRGWLSPLDPLPIDRRSDFKS